MMINDSSLADCLITKGTIFSIHSFLTKQESERQRGLAIQEGLKYEEEYLSHQIKKRAVMALKDRSIKSNSGYYQERSHDPQYNSDSNYGMSIIKESLRIQTSFMAWSNRRDNNTLSMISTTITTSLLLICLTLTTKCMDLTVSRYRLPCS